MKVKVSELKGDKLDYFTAIAIGEKNPQISLGGGCVVSHGHTLHRFYPSSEWQHGGPLIQKFQISFFHPCIGGVDTNGELLDCLQSTIGYKRTVSGENAEARSYEHDYLVAACRAIVIAQLGDEVELPDDLV